MPMRLDDSRVILSGKSCSTDPWNAHADRLYPPSTEADGSPGEMTNVEDVERLLRDRLDAIGPHHAPCFSTPCCSRIMSVPAVSATCPATPGPRRSRNS